MSVFFPLPKDGRYKIELIKKFCIKIVAYRPIR